MLEAEVEPYGINLSWQTHLRGGAVMQACSLAPLTNHGQLFAQVSFGARTMLMRRISTMWGPVSSSPSLISPYHLHELGH